MRKLPLTAIVRKTILKGTMRSRTSIALMGMLWAGLLGISQVVEAQNNPQVALSAQGEKLLAKFSGMLDTLSADVAASLPAIDQQKQAAFIEARAALAGIKTPDEFSDAASKTKHDEAKAKAESDTLLAARAILTDAASVLSGDKLDSKLMKAAILRNATPRGLAEFAQQGAAEEALLDKLFADEALMKQILVAGGANGGEYGEAMQVYTAILAKSERAREVGSIFQRLALGTAIHMPWLIGKEKGGVHNIVYRTQTTVDQVERYLHYEKAYLDGELDPAFKDMNTWECRFITDDPYSNEELWHGRAR